LCSFLLYWYLNVYFKKILVYSDDADKRKIFLLFAIVASAVRSQPCCHDNTKSASKKKCNRKKRKEKKIEKKIIRQHYIEGEVNEKQ
jgi:hypothetical protein